MAPDGRSAGAPRRSTAGSGLPWPARGNYYASLIAGDGRVYALSEDGEATVVEAGKAFKVLATNALGERTMATPAVSGGRLFIRSDATLFAVGSGR